MDNVKVKESDSHTAINVATDEIDDVHFPIYKTAYGDDGSQTPVSKENPLPITSDVESLCLLNNILTELKIMNLYNALAHNQELTKEDTE